MQPLIHHRPTIRFSFGIFLALFLFAAGSALAESQACSSIMLDEADPQLEEQLADSVLLPIGAPEVTSIVRDDGTTTKTTSQSFLPVPSDDPAADNQVLRDYLRSLGGDATSSQAKTVTVIEIAGARAFGDPVTYSCSGSCVGGGCGLEGCDLRGKICTPCSCTGSSCFGMCECTRSSESGGIGPNS